MGGHQELGAGCANVARLWCEDCDTDEFLIIESVTSCSCAIAGAVGLGYSCLECGCFAAHCVRVSEVGDALEQMVKVMRR